MAEVIDELLVRLGLETDKQQFQQAEAQFAGLRRGALALAATFTAGLGFDRVTRGVAGVNDQLGLTADQLGISTRELDSFGFALERAGGSAQNAVSLLGSANDAIDRLKMGDASSLSMASRWGLDPQQLQESTDAMQFMLRLSDQLEGKTTQEQRNILESFGLGGEGTFNLMTGGRNQLEEVLQQAQELAPTMGGLIETSREFNESLAELERSVTGVANIIGAELLPDLITFTNFISGWLSDNGGLVSDLAQGGPLKATEDFGDRWLREHGMGWLAKDVGDYVPGLSGDDAPTSLQHNDALRAAVAQAGREIGAPPGLLWAQMGQESNYNPNAVSDAGARGLAQIMPATERSLEKRFGRDLDPFDPSDAILMQSELMRENYANSGSWRESLRLYHGGYDRSQWGPVNADYVPSIMARMPGGTITQTVSIEINGAQDPRAVGDEVIRVLRETADQSRQDTANGVY